MGKLKRIISYVLVVALLLPLFIVSLPEITTSADNTDSNDRRSTFIKLAQGKNLTNFSADELDEATFRLLTLYLSNFYNCGITELYSLAKEEFNEEETKKFVQALVAAGLDESTAKTLLPAIVKVSISTATQLYIPKPVLEDYLRWKADLIENYIGHYLNVSGASGLTAVALLQDKSIISAALTTDSDFSTNKEKKTLVRRFGIFGGDYRYGILPADQLDNYISDLEKIMGEDGKTVRATLENDTNKNRWYRWISSGQDLSYGMINGREFDFVPVTYGLLISLLSDASEFTIGWGSSQFRAGYFRCNLYNITPEGRAVSCFTTNNQSACAAAIAKLDEAESRLKSKSEHSALGKSFFYDTRKATELFQWSLSDLGNNGAVEDDEMYIPYKTEDSYKGLAESCIFFQPIYIDWAGSLMCVIQGAQSVIPVVSASLNGKVMRRVDDGANKKWSAVSLDYWAITHRGVTDIYLNGNDTLAFNDGSDLIDVQLYDSDGGFGNEDIGFLCMWQTAIATVWEKAGVKSSRSLTATQGLTSSDSLFNVSNADTSALDDLFRECYKDYLNDNSIIAIGGYGAKTPVYNNKSIVYCDTLAKVNDTSDLNTIFKATDGSSFSNSGTKSISSFFYKVDTVLCSCLFITYAYYYWNGQLRYQSGDFWADLGGDAVVPEYLITYGGKYWSLPGMDEGIFKFDLQDFTQSLADDVNEQEAKTQSWIYYLLHPTAGFSYITTWVKNKVTAILLGWHEDMVGGSNSNSSTGMTAYLGFSGYTTTPSIGDLEWLSAVVDGYDSIVVYILIVLILILLCYIVVGSLTIARAVVGFFCFAFLCFLPPLMINSVVNISNETSMAIYTKKFNYWAIAQTEQYLGQLASIATTDESDPEYVQKLINMQALRDENTSQAAGYAGVRLKWMAAKKSNGGAVVKTLMKRSETYNSFADTQLARMVMNIYAQSSSAESFDFTDPYSLYLYRDQLDLYRVSAYSYNLYKEFNYGGILSQAKRYGISKASNIPEYVKWGSSFKWDYLSPTQTYSSSSVPTSLGLFEHKYAGDIYYIQAGNTTGFKGKETILGSRYRVARSDIECRLTDDSWRRSFNMNNMIELAILPITSGSSSGHASAGGQYISAESVYGVSDAADLPDIYTHFSPKMAEARGFLYRGDKYSKYGYLSNTTLATGYLLRYHQAVIESARQYYKYLEFANIGDEDGEDEIGASLGEGASFAKRGIYAPEDGFNVESFFFNNNLFGFEPSNFYGSVQWIQGRGTNQYGYDVETISNGQVNALKGLQTYSKRAVFNGTATHGAYDKDWRNAGAEDLILSYYYYGLYSESPFYYFNWNIRDQLNLSASGNIVQQETEMDDDDTVESPLVSYDYLTTNALNKTQALKDLWLGNDQAYFYNLYSAGYEGYGELRDFMNLRNFFYYVIPSMRWGTELVREWDRTYGCNYDTSKSSVKLDSDGSVLFNGNKIQDENGEWVASTKAPYKYKIEEIMCSPKYNAEEKYQIWHDVNVIRLYYCYSAWLDAMLDCDYAKEETIKIMGEEFIVEEPLNPYSYCRLDEDGNIIAGRPMVFSRSEMRFYGLNFNDLTTVEQKCITLQDNVYKETLDLMNYYTFSDEVLVQAYSLIQLFEFNKIFSQDSMFEENYILYPQGYELKAFSYDAYLRMILANATNTSVMAEASAEEGNSIYQRIAKKTSIFFGVFLILNDILAVYCVPLLKVAFIAIVFFISLALILSSAVKLELNMLTVILRSLLQPLGCFLLINIGFSFLVSLFIGSGADQVVNSQATIQLGDPTMTLIAMLIINILVTVLYFKLTKKCFADLKKYVTTLFSSVGTTVGGVATAFVGAFGAATAAGALAGSWGKSSNEKDRWLRGKKDGEGDGSGLKSTSPEQRGAANTTPEPGGSKSKASDTAPGTSTTNTDTSAVAKNKYDEKINEAKAKSEGSDTSTESSGGGKGGTKKGAHATSTTFKKNGAMSNSGHASESGEAKKSSQLDKMAEDVKSKGKKKPSKAERNAERFKANGGANAEKKEQDKSNHKKYLSSKQQRELKNARKESKQGKHNKTSSTKKGSAMQNKSIGGNKIALNAAKSKNNLNKLGSNVSKASTPKPVSAGEKASKTQIAKANKGKLTKRGESVKAKRKEASKEGSEKKIKEQVSGGNSSSSLTGNNSANRKSLKQKFKKAKSALGDFNEELARKAHNARVVGRAVTKPIRVANTAVRATAAGVGAAANSLSKSVKAGLRTNNINLNDGNKSNS